MDFHKGCVGLQQHNWLTEENILITSGTRGVSTRGSGDRGVLEVFDLS